MMRIGLENCVDTRSGMPAEGRFGVLMNRSSVDSRLRLAGDVLAEAFPGQLAALFSPQHGFWGDAQANMIETADDWHHDLKVPIHSLYSHTRRPAAETLAGLDCLVVDLQDVGTRVYTFIWTLLECMIACAKGRVGICVLDRPNPIGGEVVEGPLLNEAYRSFVGGVSIPMRHGLTIGELARLFNEELRLQVELQVVPLDD
ncbi:MAG: DUF1343 domain-containing protein, partial [Pirellulales bacterium]|nr:DUF1343 domain-containing protein [Pirellulales bacterium]